ncbi:unnamed protein product [Larinioides sclopetarius]|uniref:Phosphomannomutase n=1 Tax=Larinioides sclopetarius TaxID=280406 RepID=A0AAV2C1Q0_9ARAC
MSGKDLCLFDVDGTLTLSRQLINPEMKIFLLELNKKVAIGLVGGSDFDQIGEQMRDPNYDYNHLQQTLDPGLFCKS